MASPAYQRVETYMLLKARNQLTPDLEKSFTADKAAPEWPQLVSAYELLQRLGVAALTTRRAQFKLLQEARVYIDSGALPDLWLQSQAVSAGVPQIIRREDEFLLMGINGVVCLELDALFPAAGRFLDRLRKWNQALVADAALLEEFTADKLLTQWQEILE
jgi:accessory secretory protein Asp1